MTSALPNASTTANSSWRTGVAIVVFAALSALASGAETRSGSSPEQRGSLKVVPDHIRSTPRYPGRFAVLATTPQGESTDISRQGNWTARPMDPSLAVIDQGTVEFRSEGSTEIEIQWKDQKVRLTLETHEDDPLAYDREISSLLTRTGCNLGTCHGNLHGKGGLRLSLRGDDPPFDHHRLAREFAQRRIDLWAPDESLMLRKATGRLAHQGGVRFEVDSTEYRWIHQWIESGAPASRASPLASLQIIPDIQRMQPEQRTTRIFVIARFDDGSVRDVTRWARIESSIPTGVSLSPDGRVDVDRPIDVSLSATYLSGRSSARILFLGDPSVPTPSLQAPAHPIDALVESQCRELNIAISPRADDWTLVRRLYLVTLGRLPRPQEILAFVDDDHPDKLPRTVDRLLADPAFDFTWAMRWSDLIRNEDKVMSPRGAAILHRWLREQIASDRSMQSWMAELVSSVGSTYENPPASYHRTHRDPFTAAESSAQVFLGLRVQCAKCHNHPFDVWKQDDYYGLAAYFTTVERKQIDNKPKDELDKHIITGDEIISLAERKPDVMHPGRSRRVAPRPLALANRSEYRNDETHRSDEIPGTILEEFGRWLTIDNDQFDANLANRIWFQYFGRGIVDPPDDFRDSNPPSNPELLRWLASSLRDGDYSLKQLSRVILCSQTFARQAGADEPALNSLHGIPYFAAYPTRRLSAEILLDAVSDACEAFPQVQASHEEGHSPIRRAMEMPGIPVKKGFLRTFGKPDRLLVCECERTNQVSLGQSLSMLNGIEIRERLGQVDNRIGRMIQSSIPFTEKVEELFLASLSRRPTERELRAATELLESVEDRPKSIDEIALAVQQPTTAKQYKERRVLEDLLWALINSKEFSILR
jgi:hypothetical protein